MAWRSQFRSRPALACRSHFVQKTPPTATHLSKIDDYTLQFHLSARDHVIIPGWTTWKGGNYVQYAPSTS